MSEVNVPAPVALTATYQSTLSVNIEGTTVPFQQNRKNRGIQNVERNNNNNNMNINLYIPLNPIIAKDSSIITCCERYGCIGNTTCSGVYSDSGGCLKIDLNQSSRINLSGKFEQEDLGSGQSDSGYSCATREGLRGYMGMGWTVAEKMSMSGLHQNRLHQWNDIV